MFIEEGVMNFWAMWCAIFATILSAINTGILAYLTRMHTQQLKQNNFRPRVRVKQTKPVKQKTKQKQRYVEERQPIALKYKLLGVVVIIGLIASLIAIFVYGVNYGYIIGTWFGFGVMTPYSLWKVRRKRQKVENLAKIRKQTVAQRTRKKTKPERKTLKEVGA